MQKHVRNYYKAFGYTEGDVILCEHCKAVACDIHHVEPRSSFGSTRKDEQDDVNNLVAVCRECHDAAHGILSRVVKEIFKNIIANRNQTLKS
jgi:5-methylcytosine-specific restriction endonuclease McrA